MSQYTGKVYTRFAGTYTDTIPAASNATVMTLTPPEGFIYRLIKLYAEIAPVPASGSGTHELRWYSLCTAGTNEDFIVKSDHASVCRIQMSGFAGDSLEQPADLADQLIAINLMIGSNNDPIIINYYNDADTDQTSDFGYAAVVEIIREVV